MNRAVLTGSQASRSLTTTTRHKVKHSGQLHKQTKSCNKLNRLLKHRHQQTDMQDDAGRTWMGEGVIKRMHTRYATCAMCCSMDNTKQVIQHSNSAWVHAVGVAINIGTIHINHELHT